MNFKQITKRISYSLLVASLVVNTTLLDVAITFAAPLDDQPIQSETTKSNDTILTGLLAIGLFSLLSGGGDKQPSESTPAKTATPTSQTPALRSLTANQVASASVSADEKRAVDLMNQDRIANGLSPLTINTAVTQVARAHGQDMINRNYFAHNSPEGKSPFDRLSKAGISYRTAGENLAMNRSVDAAEIAFMNSPGHRANILNPSYTEVGIGVSYAPDGSVYVVQNFIGK